MPLPLVAEWLGHSNIETTIQYYANADISMKREAIEKATSELNPLFKDNPDINWEDDEVFIAIPPSTLSYANEDRLCIHR